MAGFRIGRGRDSRNAQQQAQHPPPPGRGRPSQGHPGAGSQSWHAPGGSGGHGEPEYFGEPQGGGYAAQGGGQRPGAPPGSGFTDNPGHTRAFSIHDPSPYGPDDGQGNGQHGHGQGGYDTGYSDGGTYTAGRAPAPAGPRLHWKQLLQGIVLRPNATFFQMRDHPVWGPALAVTFVYGLLAVFGLDETRESVINATLGTALQYVVGTGVAVVIMGLVLGAVTHTLARQFGGNGVWAPTIGLSMLIMSLSDTPRLVLAMFMGGTATAVQVVGWLTWIAAGALFTSMVSRSHDLPWPRALGASSIQLVALLMLIKLGSL